MIVVNGKNKIKYDAISFFLLQKIIDINSLLMFLYPKIIPKTRPHYKNAVSKLKVMDARMLKGKNKKNIFWSFRGSKAF